MSGLGSGEINTTAVILEDTNLSCAAREIQGPVMLPYSTNFTTTMRILQATYYMLLLICGMFLNSKVIILVAKYKALHTLSFVIALQVVVLDVILCFTIAIIGGSSVIANRWVFGEQMCSIVGLIILSTTTVRTFLMFIFVIDRFLSVFLPFFYPKHKVKITVSLSTVAWVLSVGIGVMGYVMDCLKFTPISWVCSIFGDCNNQCSFFANLLFGAVATPLTLIPAIFYAILYFKARRAKRRYLSTSLENVVDATDPFSAEWKATLTFFLLFITVFAFTLPNLTIFLIINRIYGPEVPPAAHAVVVVASNMIMLLVVTDPIVIMRNRDVRAITDQFKIRIAKKCCPSLLMAANDETSQ